MKKYFFCLIIILFFNTTVFAGKGGDDFTVENGIELYEQGKYDDAINVFETIISETDDDWDKALSNLFLGITYFSGKEDYDKSIIYLNEVFKYSRGHKQVEIGAYSYLSNIYGNRGDLEKALEITEKAIKLDDTNGQAYRMRGWVYYRMSEYNEAVADFTKAIEIDPGDSQAITLLSDVYKRQLLFEKAIILLNKSLEIENANRDTLDMLGSVYFCKGDYKLSREYYEKSLSLIIGSSTDTDCFWGLAVVYLRTNNINKAKQYYQKAIDIEKDLEGNLDKLLDTGEYFFHDEELEAIYELWELMGIKDISNK